MKAPYGYTAYGSDDTSEFTGIDKPDAANPTKEAYNPQGDVVQVMCPG